jgi:hypothetical protein
MKIALDNNKGIFAQLTSVLHSYQSNVLGIENYFLMKFLEPSIYDIPTVESNSPINLEFIDCFRWNKLFMDWSVWSSTITKNPMSQCNGLNTAVVLLELKVMTQKS